MGQEQVPSTAYILSLISGILITLGGSVSLIFRGMSTMFSGRFSGMMSGFGSALGFLGALGIAFGVIIILCALYLKKEPSRHETYGTLILVFSILSVFGGWAGFGIGLILGLVGGALAISWKPSTQGVPPAVRACPQCGRIIGADLKFCPHCGKQQSQ